MSDHTSLVPGPACPYCGVSGPDHAEDLFRRGKRCRNAPPLTAPKPPLRPWGLPEESRGDGPCMDCGTFDTPVWFTDNVLWNRIVGGSGTMYDPGGLLCPTCFIRRAQESGLRPTRWHLTAEFPWRWAE